MKTSAASSSERSLLLFAALVLGAPLAAQFRDDFDGPVLAKDPAGANGWGFVTGEGRAVMDFVQGPGFATITVDATKDRRNVWWAFIIRRVSGALDLALLEKPGHELRIEARIRTDHAPRRVNLHLNTQKTTDFHSHLMEYDLAEAGTWYTISMTTRGFEAGPGDTVNAQMALMDWGLGRYRVDVDYFKVDVVDAAKAGPDLGAPIPYHPPVADPASFAVRGSRRRRHDGRSRRTRRQSQRLDDHGRRREGLRRFGRRDARRPAPLGLRQARRPEGRRPGPPRADDPGPRALAAEDAPTSASSGSSRSSAASPPGTSERRPGRGFREARRATSSSTRR